MKKTIGTKEIVFERHGRIYLSEHYECDGCNMLCAVNAVVLKDPFPELPADRKRWAFDRFLYYVPYEVDLDGGANESGAFCSQCFQEKGIHA